MAGFSSLARALAASCIVWGVGFSAEPPPGTELPAALPAERRALLLDAACADGRRIATVGEHGLVLLSNDGGGTWLRPPTPVDSTLTAVDWAPDGVAWAVGHDAVVLRGSEGGRRWEVAYRGASADVSYLDVMALDAQRVRVVGALGEALATDDGGATWRAWDLPADGHHLNHLSRIGAERLAVAAEAGLLLLSEDSGGSWQAVPTAYGGSNYGLSPLGAAGWVLHGLRGSAQWSADGGSTWQLLLGPDSLGGFFASAPCGPHAVLLAGHDGRLTRIEAGEPRPRAVSWRRQSLGHVAALLPLPGGNILAVGDRGLHLLPPREQHPPSAAVEAEAP